ncbi:IS66 family insertion sequence element accessory protein TnpB [Fundicoccus sp. Sow4_H7]|uniref:IS66 family insertion sequence element accessory protein TnpB n=1 Tax=Fundicoccus sp. Sow4_H7 TaxID=3438784 RepID=UPI003F8DBF45
MVVDLTQVGEVYLVCGKTDLHKGIDGLAQLVVSEYQLDPFTDAVFLFCSSRRDRFKALYWDGDGFYLLYKRLENGTVHWPRSSSEALQITTKQAEQLLAGYTIIPSIQPPQIASVI